MTDAQRYGEGVKVLVLDENGDPQLKDYSAGGGSGSETPCIVDWDNLTAEEICAAVQTALASNQPVFAKYTPLFASYPWYLPLAAYGLQEGVVPTMTFIGLYYVSSTSIQGYKLVISNYGTSKYTTVFGGYFLPDPLNVANGATLRIQNGAPTWVDP